MMTDGKRKLTPEEREELHQMMLRIGAERERLRQGPILVCENGEVIRETEVKISKADPNWFGEYEIRVRRT
jgi:hypothetical protein